MLWQNAGLICALRARPACLFPPSPSSLTPCSRPQRQPAKGGRADARPLCPLRVAAFRRHRDGEQLFIHKRSHAGAAVSQAADCGPTILSARGFPGIFRLRFVCREVVFRERGAIASDDNRCFPGFPDPFRCDPCWFSCLRFFRRAMPRPFPSIWPIGQDCHLPRSG